MPQFKKEQLNKRFNIKEQYAIPSAFGMEKRRTENYYIVEE
jgi:hypothetical protein